MKRCSILFFIFTVAVVFLSAQNNPFYEGAGAAGIRIAVLPPTGSNITAQDQWLLKLVQSTITGDLNKFSAMTVIDRQNLEQILGEQNQSLSGNYSDKDFVSIGNLTNARYILAGNLTKTGSGFMLELSVSDVQTGERKASFPPKNCTMDDLQSTAIVRQASGDLLGQLGVTLTALGKQTLQDSVSAVPQAVTSADTSSTVTTEKGERISFSDYLSRTADALYAIGEIQDALGYYRSLTYYYPGNYRGWLGIVRCFSRNYTNFNFVDSEIYMERASITATGNAERQEVQKVRALFDAQWPEIKVKREQQAIEEAKRREDNFQRMRFRQKNIDGVLIEYNGSSEEVIIPPEITAIGDAAFRQNGRIKRVVLHNKVTSIGKDAFAVCSGLTEIVIPASVTSIGEGAFRDCSSLPEIIIPASVTVIPRNVFSWCKELRSVTIGPGVQTIEGGAFGNCQSLTSIIIPRNVTSIGSGAFTNSTKLRTVTLLNNNVTIGRRAFYGCTAISNREELISRFGAEIFN
jgi:TolB-like protein